MNAKSLIKKFIITAAALVAVLFIATSAYAQEKDVRILFTHDIHSYLDTKTGEVDGKIRQYGNAAKLATLIKQEKGDNAIYVDAGDIAMGTLYQAAFSTNAYELQTLGIVGCDYVTFGNHEFDYGCEGVASSINAALSSGSKLPKLVESSFDFSGELTDEQSDMKAALERYGMQEYFIEEINGVKIGIFAIEGPDSIDCIQSDVDFLDYIVAAQKMVDELSGKCDLILCLSHTGTNGDGETGEDFDLLEKVKGIDVLISAHTHTTYYEPVYVGDTILVSAGCYLQNLGELDLTVSDDGKVSLANYSVIPIDETVEEDAKVCSLLETFKENIKNTYLKEYAGGGSYDDVLCSSDFDFISLDDMYASSGEFNLGNLIADSYRYKANEIGVTDIDVFMVGLGTIRGSIQSGDVTLADAFEICSLGVGADGSAGHPLVACYVTGAEIKLLAELDISLSSLVSSVKMSYNGLQIKYNNNRVILDRVYEVNIVSEDGTITPIDEEKTYKVCANMYAINMLDMVNDLTKGILKITPVDENGAVITDFYQHSLKDASGSEVKEWIAFKDYLASFDDSKIPESYKTVGERKTETFETGLEATKNAGTTTIVVMILGVIIIILLVLLCISIYKNIRYKEEMKAKKKAKKEKKKAKKLAKKEKRKAKKENQKQEA